MASLADRWTACAVKVDKEWYEKAWDKDLEKEVVIAWVDMARRFVMTNDKALHLQTTNCLVDKPRPGNYRVVCLGSDLMGYYIAHEDDILVNGEAIDGYIKPPPPPHPPVGNFQRITPPPAPPVRLEPSKAIPPPPPPPRKRMVPPPPPPPTKHT